MQRSFFRLKQILFLPLPLFQFLLHFGMQSDGDAVAAVELFQGHLRCIIRPDDVVRQFQTLFHGLLLDGGIDQCMHFRFRQVIDHVGLYVF